MTFFLNAITELTSSLRSAPFETPPAAAPQDKLARLEGRTMFLQHSVVRRFAIYAKVGEAPDCA